MQLTSRILHIAFSALRLFKTSRAVHRNKLNFALRLITFNRIVIALNLSRVSFGDILIAAISHSDSNLSTVFTKEMAEAVDEIAQLMSGYRRVSSCWLTQLIMFMRH